MGRFYAVFEMLKDFSGIVGTLTESVVDTISHFQSCLEGCFFASILPIGKVFGELIPLAAYAESPSLE